MNTKVVHIVHSSVLGGLLRAALKNEDVILILPDSLSFGPLVEDETSIGLLAGRSEFWSNRYKNLEKINLNDDWLLSCESELVNADEVIFYVGYNLDEKLSYIVANQIIRKLGASIQKSHFVDLAMNPKNGLLVTRPDRIQNVDSLNCFLKAKRVINQLENDCLSKLYELIISDDPGALNDFDQECETFDSSLLVEALKQLYPDYTYGLNQLEYKLLESCANSGPKLSLIIVAMICNDENFNQCPDLILKEMAKQFASNELKQPLLECTGDLSSFKLDVQLTDFGKAVLAGEENHVNTNGIDNWIGGVHLKSEYGSPWYYDQVTKKLLRT